MAADRTPKGFPRIRRGGGGLLLAYAVSGVAALTYEIAWFRDLSVMFGSTAYASAITLTAFMLGLGIGSIVGARWARRTDSPLRAAAWTEACVAATSVLAVLVLRSSPTLFFEAMKGSGASSAVFLGLQFLISLAVMTGPTTAMGATFPIVMTAVANDKRFGQWAGTLYATNTVGGIFGAIMAGFVLVPMVGTKGALVAAAVLSMAAGGLFLHLAGVMSRDERLPWPAFLATAAATVLCVAAIPAPPTYPLTLAQIDRIDSVAEWEQARAATEILFDKDSPYSRVTVEKYPDGLINLRNGALVEGSTGWTDGITPSLLGALPSVSAGSTSTALVVGLGTGFTSAAMLDMGFDKVRTVEINPAVVEASSFFVLDWLEGDPAWELAVDDARADILTREQRYDVITSEPSWPLNAACAPLFTQDFMEAVASRLTPQGTYCQWLPNYLLNDDDIAMMYKTMRQVFPRVDVWAMATESDIAMIGFMDADSPSPADIESEARRVLAGTEFWPKPDFKAYGHEADLEAALTDASVPVNTDAHSRLEYRVVWNLIELDAVDGTDDRR